ncbi:TetR/AcrR family transcriptional regulator [Candidatus Solirubrobacter pratensis]|uniref:TetR/AcrR family transcriptional regulator n=1 Tax=Candidatus Solirubrobacter pratensis TaxID=1298857 RepID=UPI0004892918|nr:TetR/AcrR family transcriptional regulator [Candidatus Solirubrobacter pratensis]
MARHKEFDPDQALERAMRLFWERGYERTSVQDLVERTGVHKRSMYDTFGHKHSLYLRSLDRYVGAARADLAATLDGAQSPRAALRALLSTSINDGSNPRGCFAVNCASETALDDPEVARRVGDFFAASERLILDLVLEGQRAGEIPARHEPEALANALHNGWIGVRIQARAGREPEQIAQMIDGLLALLD